MNKRMTKLNIFLLLIVIILLVTVLVGFNYLQNEIDSLKKQIRSESNPFVATGKQQSTMSVNGQYDVVSWNFTFHYVGEKSIQNVNFFLDNQDTPFKTVPEITTNWVYTHIWTPEDLNATRKITISWQGGTQSFEFQP
jgi:hypothetical protein